MIATVQCDAEVVAERLCEQPSCAAFQALILSWSLRFLQRVTASGCTSSCGGTVRQVRLEEPQHLPGQGRTTVPEPRM